MSPPTQQRPISLTIDRRITTASLLPGLLIFTMVYVCYTIRSSLCLLRFLLQVLADLMKSTMDNARYIMALCGLTFICLATMNLIQSWPRGKYHKLLVVYL